MKSTIACNNWDSFNPQKLYDGNGKCIGTLQPRATRDQLGCGIQSWSLPKTETRLRSEP